MRKNEDECECERVNVKECDKYVTLPGQEQVWSHGQELASSELHSG